MTQNPFDALGGGGFDMNALLQQAQQMQQQLEEAQAALARQTVDGTVAGGAVTVTANGVGELVGVAIRAGEFDGTDPDDLSDLSDLIVAAYRDARAKSEALAGESMAPLTEGLGGMGGGLGGGLGGGTGGGLGFGGAPDSGPPGLG